METRILVLLSLAVIVSGCVDQIDPGSTGVSGDGDALEIHSFEVSDEHINPGQRANVELILRNYNDERVDFDDISLYSTGILNLVGDQDIQSRCTSDSLDQMRQDTPAEMQCNWVIEAPEEIDFDSRPVSFRLNLEYDSSLSTDGEPFSVEFDSFEDIDRTRKITHTYTNGEVSLRLETDEPQPLEGGNLDIVVEPAGSGNVVSDYEMGYSPENVFEGCETGEVEEAVFEDRAEFGCSIVPGTGSSVTRNLVVSTSYKYVQSPSLTVEVVN